MVSVASELSLAGDIGGHTKQQQQWRQQQQQFPSIATDVAAAGEAGLAGSSSSSRTPRGAEAAAAAAAVEDELDVADEEPDALLLLSAGGDGMLRVWLMNHLAQGQMLCTLPGAYVGLTAQWLARPLGASKCGDLLARLLMLCVLFRALCAMFPPAATLIRVHVLRVALQVHRVCWMW
jgi:hypothetical protein